MGKGNDRHNQQPRPAVPPTGVNGPPSPRAVSVTAGGTQPPDHPLIVVGVGTHGPFVCGRCSRWMPRGEGQDGYCRLDAPPSGAPTTLAKVQIGGRAIPQMAVGFPVRPADHPSCIDGWQEDPKSRNQAGKG